MSGKRKNGPGNQGQNSLEEASKLEGILRNFEQWPLSISAKDDILVIAMTHRNAITVENLAI